MTTAYQANTMTDAVNAAIERKVQSYGTWRAMGVLHADAIESVMRNSIWGPKLKAEAVSRIEALGRRLDAAGGF